MQDKPAILYSKHSSQIFIFKHKTGLAEIASPVDFTLRVY